jgi:hypothetical protein
VIHLRWFYINTESLVCLMLEVVLVSRICFTMWMWRIQYLGLGPVLWKLVVEGVARLVLIKVVQLGLRQSHSCLG